MKGRLAVLALATASSLAGAYVYDSTLEPAHWAQNGSGAPSEGTRIYYGSLSGNANDYEIWANLNITAPGGTLALLLRAGTTTTQLVANGGSGANYISVEFTEATWPGAAAMSVKQAVNGSVTQLAGATVSLTGNDIVRAVIWGTNLWVYTGNTLVGQYTVPLTYGYAGIGGFGNTVDADVNNWIYANIGHHDTTAPGAINSSAALSVYSSQISVRWTPTADDANGVGLFRYEIFRSGVLMGYSATPAYTDFTAVPTVQYTYAIDAVDFHGNSTAQSSVVVTTPPATFPDPRRVGVRPEGAYWGGGGEQIDMLSGNLNFSLPVGTAMQRSGATVSVGLSYNSQNWRQDGGVNWQLGTDIGYGFGWKVQIGSVTPFYANWASGVDHYTCTDGTGAEFRLDVNNSGVWSSTQAVYMWFDANAGILHFKDGSFWVMGSTSAGSEADAGTMYPTIIEDVSGNQIVVNYQAYNDNGYNTNGYNSTGRINAIADSRSTGCSLAASTTANPCGYPTFVFHYAGSKRLQSISGPTGGYTFTMTSAALAPPFGADAGYNGLTTQQLTTLGVPAGGNTQYTFAYDTAGAAELTQVTFPQGGHLRWIYSSDAYGSGRSLRAVTSRYLATASSGGPEWQPYVITRDSVAGQNQHGTATLTDASGVGAKTWNFMTAGTGAPAWKLGLAAEFVQKASVNGTVYTDDTYTWQQDGGGHPYIATKVSVTDPGTANAQSSKTTQVLDAFGNTTQAASYPYNNGTTPLKTYNYTYLTNSVYLGNYLRNRLLTATVTLAGVSTPKPLVQNYYDGKVFGQPAHPGFTSLCGNAGIIDGPYPTTLFDPSPPMTFANRGLMSGSASPAVSNCVLYHGYGALSRSKGSNGSATTASADAATNYAEPMTVSTQSYGESISYNSWLGVTGTTGWNGEQLSMTYDGYGRPASGASAYGASTNFSYNDGYPRQQMRSGPDGYTRTTLDGLGRTVKTERGANAGSIQSIKSSSTDTTRRTRQRCVLGWRW